ncbi:MAG TPA: hypothetical protein VNV44_14970 [Solirubrobacteraceae bacterium]|jgi:hypothetical protein|nr:hypothetical protein [Solirubrobacteraceae bacterium]
MGFLRGHRRTRSVHQDRGTRYYPTPRLLSREGIEDAPTRYEPQTLSAKAPAVDPYEQWRARREAERDKSRVETVRWVQRQRGKAAPASPGTAATEAVRWVNHYRGAGSAPTGREASGQRVAAPPGERERPVDLVGAQGSS